MSEPAEAKSSAGRVIEGVSVTVIAALVIATAGFLFHLFVGRDGRPSVTSTPTPKVESTDKPTASPTDDGLDPIGAEPTDVSPIAQTTASPAATRVFMRKGIVLGQLQGLDLDADDLQRANVNYNSVPASIDVWLSYFYGGQLKLSGENSTQIAGAPSIEACKGNTTKTLGTAIDTRQNVGKSVCFRTSNHDFAVVTIRDRMLNPLSIRLDIVVWRSGGQ